MKTSIMTMCLLLAAASLGETRSARQAPKLPEADPNYLGSLVANFESMRTQLNTVSAILGELNAQFNRAIQTGVKAVSGLEAESGTEAPAGQPSQGTGFGGLPGAPTVQVPNNGQVPTNQEQVVGSVPNAGSVPSTGSVPNQETLTGSVPNSGSAPSAETVTSAAGQNGTAPQAPEFGNTTAPLNITVPNFDLGQTVLGSFQDALRQLGSVTRTVGQISDQFNRIVQTSSRLVTGLEAENRFKRQVDIPGVSSIPGVGGSGGSSPINAITNLIGQLSSQVSGLSRQVTGLLGGLGGLTGSSGTGSGRGGGAVDGILGNVRNVLG